MAKKQENTIPSFESYASAWQEAQRDFDSASGKFSDAVRALLMQYVDACREAGVSKDEGGIKGMQAEMLGCQTVVDWAAAGWSPTNLRAWVACATRAYFHGLPDVKSSYALDPKLKFPWAKASKGGKAKPASKAPADMPPAPDMAPLTGPQSSADVRAFVEGYAKTLTAYLNKHMALADLPTRDVVQHFAAAVAKLPKP